MKAGFQVLTRLETSRLGVPSTPKSPMTPKVVWAEEGRDEQSVAATAAHRTALRRSMRCPLAREVRGEILTFGRGFRKRSEERRVGKECWTGMSGEWSRYRHIM